MHREIGRVSFPRPRGININMMPFVFGDPKTLPGDVRAYADMIGQCSLERGSIAYLSVAESLVEAGSTQRRGGVHTDGTSVFGWGGGTWGSNEPHKGIYLASTNGHCRVWDTQSYDVDAHGAMAAPACGSIDTRPDTLYWITDRTPHEALPQEQREYRQWIRVVANDIGAWFAKHSTPNPFGIQPEAVVIHESKFAS